jgi:hypothetical protein
MFLIMAANELGYTTLSVAEPRRGVSVGAPSCRARSVTEDNVPLGRARAKVPSAACQPQLDAGSVENRHYKSKPRMVMLIKTS